MLCVVAPVDQIHDTPLLAVSMTESPWQNVVGPSGVMVTTGAGVTVMVIEAVEVHNPLLMVTEYVPEAFTVMSCVIAPVDHNHTVPLLA